MTAPSIRMDAPGSEFLHTGWRLAPAPPGAFDTAEAALGAGLLWQDALVPGTVADSLDLDATTSLECDADDWWYHCAFPAPPAGPDDRLQIAFEGLATIAEVWLNGSPLLNSRNLFLPQACDITSRLQAHNDLVICFRSLRAELAKKRPRPRWKTALIAHQNLRWVRTTLLGRIPGWAPAPAPVGPWRSIRLEILRRVTLTELDLQTTAEGSAGRVSLSAGLETLGGCVIHQAHLRIGDHQVPLTLQSEGPHLRLSGGGLIPDAPLWWPHTHGAPRMLACAIELQSSEGPISMDCGRIGFKAITLDTRDGEIHFQLHGQPVFCRGACWTPQDIRSLSGDLKALRHALLRVRDAGANMLRVSGTMVYESDAFYDLCDELGILVWQDFMFANMDYPFGDEAFLREAKSEVTHQLKRLQRHPCIAVYCGGSEIAQQAAMMGRPAEEWSNAFFSEELPTLCAALHRDIPYFPSTPTGGVMPFHLSTGLAHYYGVGAYKRPLEDVRRAGIKFAPECLGFSNVPDEDAMERMFDGAPPMPHHPLWKRGVPRDNGAGWDFEDIRDHYLRMLFNLDPIELRSQDPARYFAISRVVSGEVMKAVFAEWRRPGSSCGGGLVWFFKDLQRGAGWGLLDSTGHPKAVYWYLRRAWAQQTLLMTDEGLEGLHLHLLNETSEALEGLIELELFQGGRISVGRAEQPISLPAFGARTLSADGLLPHFSDLTYAYRFGPPRHDVVIARLISADGTRVLAQDVHFPLGLTLPFQEASGITTAIAVMPDGAIQVTIQSGAFIQSVALSCSGYEPDDNHFHVAPGRAKVVRFAPCAAPAAPFKAHVSALNLATSITLRADH